MYKNDSHIRFINIVNRSTSWKTQMTQSLFLSVVAITIDTVFKISRLADFIFDSPERVVESYNHQLLLLLISAFRLNLRLHDYSWQILQPLIFIIL